MDLPVRKRTRLPHYDYSSNGYYFVTICTKDKMSYLSKISVGQGLAPAVNSLTVYGKAAEEELLRLKERYNQIWIDKYVIMPNHIHCVVVIEQAAGASPCPTLSDVICAFKSLTVRRCRENGFSGMLWQNSFHDHVIRNQNDYERIWQYIDTNPQKWADDCFYNE